MANKKIVVRIDWPIYNEGEYRDLIFPSLLSAELEKDERFIVSNSLDDKEKDLDVIVVFSGGSFRTIGDMKLSTLSIGQLRKKFFSRFYHPILYLGRFLSLRKINFFDRLTSPNVEYEKTISRIIRKNPNMKIVHRLDGSYQDICKRYGYDHTIVKINKDADITIYQSRFAAKLWEQERHTIFGTSLTLNPKRKVVIPNGVDTVVFKPMGEKIQYKGRWKILHASASSNPNKGLVRVLELANILKNNEEIQFYLVGRQINDPVCGKEIGSFENVHYLGYENNRESLSKIFRSMDIFLYPSKDDCSPNVLLEAMASGLPVVTIASGGNAEIIIKEGYRGGTLMDENNPVLSLKTMIENFNEYQNDALNIIRHHHTLEKSIDAYKDAIRDAVNG